jgi:hypothetical protein
LVTKWAIPALGVVGFAAVVLGVELGAGFAAVGACVLDGAVVCASALVKANPLTAATAMNFLSM